MVVVEKNENRLCLTLEPNRSATWRQTYIFVGIVAGFVSLIAIAWSIAGAWMILPFAGIEVALLAYFMHRVTQSTYQQQQIRIDDTQVFLSTKKSTPPSVFDRADLTLLIVSSENVFDTCQLFFCGADTHTELGEFLNQQDKEIIIHQLTPFFPLKRLSKAQGSLEL